MITRRILVGLIVVDAMKDVPMRLLAIGDIHGCLTAFNTLLDELRPGTEDVLVTLGDYVDRGPDSQGVMERLLALRAETTLVPLLGNHDVLFKEVVEGTSENFKGWLSVGGLQTLESYGGKSGVPDSHVEFLNTGCRLWFEPEGEKVFFVHGSAHPDLPLAEQPEEWLLWRRIHDAQWPHQSGKIMICGHTAQRSGLPLILANAICIDTWAFGEGWLTCYDVHGGLFIQSNQAGEIRQFTFDELIRAD
jgi:serine/threonine protein phosphatase 1